LFEVLAWGFSRVLEEAEGILLNDSIIGSYSGLFI
jgi:hypothetical protein